jgi:hypothetical protein
MRTRRTEFSLKVASPGGIVAKLARWRSWNPQENRGTFEILAISSQAVKC